MTNKLIAVLIVSSAAFIAAQALAQETSLPSPPLAQEAPAGVAIDMTARCPRVLSEQPRYYPQRAMNHGQNGNVVLDCQIDTTNLKIASCIVANEVPTGWGFGDAALNIACHFTVHPRTENGSAGVNGPTGTSTYQTPDGQTRSRVPVNFRLQN